MPRRGPAPVRKIELDAVYSDVLVTKLVNRSMKDGKKSVARKQIYGAFEKIAAETKRDAVEVFLEALDNIRPEMEVRPRRVGGAAYQVPMPVRGERRDALAIRWLIAAARARSNSEYKTFADKLASEILDAVNNEGGAVKKRIDIEKMAEANKAFAHFRW